MDPNEALRAIRLYVERIKAGPASPADLDDNELAEWWLDEAEQLATHVEGLDQWLSRNGFLPTAWAVTRIPGVVLTEEQADTAAEALDYAAEDMRYRADNHADDEEHEANLRKSADAFSELNRMLWAAEKAGDEQPYGRHAEPLGPPNPAHAEWVDDPEPHKYDQHPTLEDEEGCLVCTVCGQHVGAPWHG